MEGLSKQSGNTSANELVLKQGNKLERWELFRNEMRNHQNRLGKLAASFLDLGAFDSAAKCAINAEGIKYVLGRMPEFVEPEDE